MRPALLRVFLPGIVLLGLQACTVPQAPRLAPSAYPEKVQNESSAYWMERWRAYRDERPPRDGRPRLVLLGDSMVERLPAGALDGRTGGGWQIVNRGIGGDKIGGWSYYGVRDRLEVSVRRLEPDAVFLLIGVNDIVFAGTPAGLMREHAGLLLGELAEAAPGARLIVCALLPVRGAYAELNGSIRAFNEELERLVVEAGAVWIDPGAALAGEGGELRASYASDDIHLSEAGYAVLVDRLVRALGG